MSYQSENILQVEHCFSCRQKHVLQVKKIFKKKILQVKKYFTNVKMLFVPGRGHRVHDIDVPVWPDEEQLHRKSRFCFWDCSSIHFSHRNHSCPGFKFNTLEIQILLLVKLVFLWFIMKGDDFKSVSGAGHNVRMY